MESKNKKMKISEIFYSIQGEGKYTGVPSVFIRTSYCNLRCSWCDTPYTSHKPEDKEGTIEEIMNQIERYSTRWRQPHFVLTGGEPLIQPHACHALCESIKNRYSGAIITVETNGTKYAPIDVDLMSISPKLKSSAPHKHQVTENMAEAHESIRQHTPLDVFRKSYNCQFKFVVCSDEDLEEVLHIIDLFKIPPHEVYLMPEGRTSNELSNKSEEVVKICLNHGFNYSDRLHVRIWENKRGV